MEQIYIHHFYWEDFKNGMYKNKSDCEYFHKIQSIHILSNPALFENIMLDMLESWTYCIDHNLSNKNYNRKAYLGAAACNFSCGIPEYCTRLAWNSLSRDVQQKANNSAIKIIKQYEYLKQKHIQLCLKFI